MHLRLLQKKAMQKNAEAAVDLIGNEIAERVTKASKASPQDNSVTNKEENIGFDREIYRERYISPEQRQKIIDDLKLICSNNIIMEYQKIINLLGNTQNEESKFRTRSWVEINDESRGTYNASNQIKLKL